VSTAASQAGAGPRFSVVIPAHDEAAVIGRCLASFVGDLVPGEAEIIVVANGCTDRTADVARAFTGVSVFELVEASKTAALNAGDEAATAFPRVFLDADIDVSADTLRHLASALEGPAAAVGAPRAALLLDGSSAAVRAFYRVHARLPYMAEGMTGTGVYALSRAGRARFERFPDLTADDLFVQRLFTPPERVVLEDRFMVRVPRTLAALVAVRTRVAAGNRQLALDRPNDASFGSSAGSTGRALAHLVRDSPREVVGAAVYVGVTAVARSRARSRRDRGAGWLRDQTTRT